MSNNGLNWLKVLSSLYFSWQLALFMVDAKIKVRELPSSVPVDVIVAFSTVGLGLLLFFVKRKAKNGGFWTEFFRLRHFVPAIGLLFVLTWSGFGLVLRTVDVPILSVEKMERHRAEINTLMETENGLRGERKVGPILEYFTSNAWITVVQRLEKNELGGSWRGLVYDPHYKGTLVNYYNQPVFTIKGVKPEFYRRRKGDTKIEISPDGLSAVAISSTEHRNALTEDWRPFYHQVWKFKQIPAEPGWRITEYHGGQLQADAYRMYESFRQGLYK